MSVRCMICNEEFGNASHLRSAHGITTGEYRKRFPDAPLPVHSEETKELIRKSLVGRTHSEESKQRMSEAKLGNTNTLGLIHSEESKRLMSKSHLGRTHSEETKRLISEAQLGRTHSEESKKLMSKSHLGNTNALGFICSEETKRRISASLVGHPGTMGFTGKTHSEESKKLMSRRQKETWQDPEVAKRRSMYMKPNESELQLQSILDKHFPGEWKYVGDGQVWFGGRSPDFINVNCQKQVIEMFGIYWHDTDLFPNRMTEEELIAHYKKYGLDCLVIWEYDIFDEDEIVKRVMEVRGL